MKIPDMAEWAENNLKAMDIGPTDTPLRLYPAQKKMLQSTHPQKLIRAHRRSGMTVAAAITAYCLAKENPGVTICVAAPSSTNVHAVINNILAFGDCTKNKMPSHNWNPAISFENGSKIVGTYNTRCLVGSNIDAYIVDNALHGSMDFWIPLINSNFTDKPTYIFGTPNDTNDSTNYFYTLCKQELSVFEKIVIPVSRELCMLSTEKLDDLHMHYPETWDSQWLVRLPN